MNDTIEKLKIEFENNKESFKKEYECALNRKISSVEIIENNLIFEQLHTNIAAFESFINASFEFQIKVKYEFFITLIEKKKGGILKLSNTITLFLQDGSHLRCSPYKEDSIEISRIWVNPINHRNGIGSMLMNLFFELIQFSESEPSSYFLECTGAVGLGDNAQTIGIDVQTKFFRKFGFRVDYRKEYPNYVTMKLENNL
jgi:hypothetical protein